MSDVKISVSYETQAGEVSSKGTLSLEGYPSTEALVFFREWLGTTHQEDTSEFAARLRADVVKLNAAADVLDQLTQTLNQQ